MESVNESARLLYTMLHLIKKQPQLELEADLSKEDKEKISKWSARLAVEAYEQGLKDGEK